MYLSYGAPSPQLTAVDLPVERQAREVVTMLVERLHDPDAPLRQLVLAPSLTVRGQQWPRTHPPLGRRLNALRR